MVGVRAYCTKCAHERADQIESPMRHPADLLCEIYHQCNCLLAMEEAAVLRKKIATCRDSHGVKSIGTSYERGNMVDPQSSSTAY